MDGTRFWQQAGIDNLQIVIFGKINNKMVSQRFDFTQCMIDHHRADSVDQYRTDKMRIVQMTLATAVGAKSRHGTAQSLRPVARTELLALAGYSEDKEFIFCRFGCAVGHRYVFFVTAAKELYYIL